MDDLAEWTPDKKTFELHLNSIRFIAGVEEGRWSVLESNFPHLYVRVNCRDPEAEVQFAYDFHLICDGYPLPGPFVERWNFITGCRPPAPATNHGSPGFVDALKDWSEVQDIHGGIYRAWQRTAAPHGDWAQKFPEQAWHRERDLTFIMERLYELVVEQAIWLSYNKQSA